MVNCLYIATGANLPDQNASALRVSSIVNALSRFGYDFTVIGQCPAKQGDYFEVSSRYRVKSTYEVGAPHSFFDKIRVFLFPKKMLWDFVVDSVEEKPIDIIFIYQIAPIPFMKKLVSLCKKRGIRLVFDIVEYQNLSQQRNFIGYWFNYRPAKAVITKFTRNGIVVSISSYLTDFFLRRGIPSIFVPFFFDVSKMKNTTYSPSKLIRIVYAGAPFGSRDTIANAVKGFLLLNDEERERFRFVFAGVTREQMKDLGLSEKILSQSDSHFSYLGRVPHEKVLEIYAQSEYSLLLKPENKRLSKAGFPTKVSESWSLSTPVIANLTGDMGKYMRDMVNGIVAESDSPEDFAIALRRSLQIDEESYARLREEARKTAEKELDIEVFAERIKNFIEDNPR